MSNTARNNSSQILDAELQQLVDFLSVRNTSFYRSELIVVLGSNDLAVPIEAAKLYRQGVAPNVIACGGVGRLSDGLDRPEGLVYSEILRAEGIPESSLFVESKSTNTGENIQFGMQIIKEHFGELPVSVALIQTPVLQRRAELTFRKQFPDIKVFSWAAYLPTIDDSNRSSLRALSLGEIDRLLAYGPGGKGHIVDPQIPAEILESSAKLKSFAAS